MKILNSPILFLIIAGAFIALCVHCYPPAPQEITYPVEPASKQSGYDAKEVRKMNRFVAFQVKQVETFEALAPQLENIYPSK